jgi:hypothetical protein
VAKKVTGEDIVWKDEVDDSCYLAAGKYLSLLMPDANARNYVSLLRKAPARQYSPHDILRAARLKPAKPGDPVVAAAAGGRRSSDHRGRVPPGVRGDRPG